MRNFLLITFLITPAIFAADFTDPAPPAVAQRTATISPAAPSKELTFIAAPKPLPKNAITTDWPNFLGPNLPSTSSETGIIKTLPAKPAVVFEYEKGTGYSAPAILDDRLIVFHRVADEEIIDCLHRETGQRHWRQSYPSTYQDRYGYTNGPRCAPVIDKSNSLVFTLGAAGKLTALDLLNGKIIWQRDILADFKLEPNFFGVGATPLIVDDLLILNIGAKNACAVAFDLKTGAAKWAASAPQDWGPSYASPLLAKVFDQPRVFIFAGGESRPATGGLLCLDPKTGAVDFAFPWRGKRFESVNASSPLIFDNKVYIAECYGKGGVLLQLSLEAGKLAAKQLWDNEKLSTHFMVALHKDGHLYGCDGHGPNNCPLVCLDLKTGDEKWRIEPDLSESIKTRTGEERKLNLNSDRCHLLHVDGVTFCLTEWGHLLTLDLSPTGPKITSRQWLFAAGETWAPPVLSRGLMYVMQNTPDKVGGKAPRLVCIDLRDSR